MGCGPSREVQLGLDLMKAVCEGNLSKVNKKLQQGAPVNFQVQTADRGTLTPLFCSVTNNSRDFNIFMLLIRAGAPVNVMCGVNLHTPLMMAALFGAHDMMRELLKRGAFVTLGEKGGTTPLHYTVLNKDAFGTTLLLNANANPNSRNLKYITPLHIACMNGDLAIIRILKAAGAKSDIIDHDGAKPADYARKAGHGEVIKYI